MLHWLFWKIDTTVWQLHTEPCLSCGDLVVATVMCSHPNGHTPSDEWASAITHDPFHSIKQWIKTQILRSKSTLTNISVEKILNMFNRFSVLPLGNLFMTCTTAHHKGAEKERKTFDWPVLIPTSQRLPVQPLQSVQRQSVCRRRLMLLAGVSPPQRRQQQRPRETPSHRQVGRRQRLSTTLCSHREEATNTNDAFGQRGWWICNHPEVL